MSSSLRICALIAVILSLPFMLNASPTKWVIVGNNGTGWALGRELAASDDHEAVMFVRNKEKVAKTFANDAHKPTLVQGDILNNDTSTFEAAAHGADYVVLAQAFPYKIWADSLRKTIDTCAAVAKKNNASLIFFTRPYSYGMTPTITETTTYPTPEAQPSFQGKVLAELEQHVADLGTHGGVKTITICHTYIYGPNVGDGLLSKNFAGIPQNATKGWFSSRQKWDWIGSDNIRVQLTYTPDLARFTMQYVTQPSVQQTPHSRINFAGRALSNIDEMGKAYAELAHEPYKKNLYSRSSLSLAAAANQNAKRAKDIYYSFENEVMLDDTARRGLFTFTLTSLDQSLLETYQWYTNNS